MGLTNTVHWTAWFITSFITIFISITTLALLLKLGNILVHSNVLVIIFVLAMFSFATIALAFLISVFFSNANISAACGGIIYFFTYLPYPITLWFEEQMNFSHKGLAVSGSFLSDLLQVVVFGIKLLLVDAFSISFDRVHLFLSALLVSVFDNIIRFGIQVHRTVGGTRNRRTVVKFLRQSHADIHIQFRMVGQLHDH